MTHTLEPNDRDRLVTLKRELNRHKSGKATIVPPATGLFMAAQSHLDKKLGSREAHIELYRWAFDNNKISSSKDLEGWQKFAIVMWAKPAKLGDDWPWTFDRQFLNDCFILKTNIEVSK